MGFCQNKATNLRSRIICAAGELFLQYGIKAVSMDELARKLAISKRTLYDHFSDKEELLLAYLEDHISQMRSWAKAIEARSETVLHVILEIYSEMLPQFRNYSPRFREDVQRYPRAVELLQSHRTQHIRETHDFFRTGLEQGIFLPGINYEILSRMILQQMDTQLPADLMEKYTQGEIQATFLLTLLHGACTPKGRQVFETYLAEYRSIQINN